METMSDRELLEWAAKAAGYQYARHGGYIVVDGIPGNWNPLKDDGDALRLAVKLNLSMDLFEDGICVGYTPGSNDCDQVMEVCESDPYAATRRAIVRAAAEIGRARG